MTTPTDIPALLARANRKNRYTLAQAWDLIDLLAAALEKVQEELRVCEQANAGLQDAFDEANENAIERRQQRDAALELLRECRHAWVADNSSTAQDIDALLAKEKT